jgi:truncated hemoglobin YjbI
VDAFIERLLVNDVLNANPAIRAARDRVPKAGLKVHLTTQVCQVTGGPCRYVGRSMKESHAHLNITQKEWTAMVADFRKTLDDFKVPAAEQEELVKIVEGTRGDIVVGAKAVTQRWGLARFPVAAVFAALALAAPAEGAPPPLLGQPAPPFRLRGVDGAPLSLGDLRGRFVVLHFGASW